MSSPVLPSVADCDVIEIRLHRGGCTIRFQGDVQGTFEVTVPDTIGVFDFDAVGEALSHLEWRDAGTAHASILVKAEVKAAKVIAFLSPWTNAPVLEVVTTSTVIHYDPVR